jgi:hypothetical protein
MENGNHGSVDLPIIDISALDHQTGKKILDAFVSHVRNLLSWSGWPTKP